MTIELLELHDLDTHHARLWRNLWFRKDGRSFPDETTTFSSEGDAYCSAEEYWMKTRENKRPLIWPDGLVTPFSDISHHMQIPVLE